jgi:hypothetical protein
MNANMKEWSPDLNLDGFASVAVLAAGVLVAMFAGLSSSADAALAVNFVFMA